MNIKLHQFRSNCIYCCGLVWNNYLLTQLIATQHQHLYKKHVMARQGKVLKKDTQNISSLSARIKLLKTVFRLAKLPYWRRLPHNSE
jgi:hypothetical protein